jgi:DNA-binding response OmpR family regulator
MRADDGEEAILRILVADDHQFQRRLISETLRGHGRVHINFAEDVDHCLVALAYFQPDILIVDWALGGEQGLNLVKRLRAGEGGDAYKKLPIIMVTARTRLVDIEYARAAGVDEFVLRPFSTATMMARITEIRTRRREFVESTRYIGPCRRRKRGDYDGPRRRLFDGADKNADAPDIQIRKGLARMYVERIQALLNAATPDNANGMRDVCLACGQLSVLADDMKDKLFMSAASSLFSYLKGVGSAAAINAEVVKAHLDSIVQLADLPNSQFEIRQTVAQQLGIMVTKKLRQAGQAA